MVINLIVSKIAAFIMPYQQVKKIKNYPQVVSSKKYLNCF